MSKLKQLKRLISLMLAICILLGNVPIVWAAPKEDSQVEFTWKEQMQDAGMYEGLRGDDLESQIGKVYLGESVSQVLQMLEDPSLDVDLEKFFEGTLLAGLTKEDLLELKEEGMSFSDYMDEKLCEQGNWSIRQLNASRNIAVFDLADDADAIDVPIGTLRSSVAFHAAMPAIKRYAGKNDNVYKLSLTNAKTNQTIRTLCIDPGVNERNGDTTYRRAIFKRENLDYYKRALYYYLEHKYSKANLAIAQGYVWGLATGYKWKYSEEKQVSLARSAAGQAYVNGGFGTKSEASKIVSEFEALDVSNLKCYVYTSKKNPAYQRFISLVEEPTETPKYDYVNDELTVQVVVKKQSEEPLLDTADEDYPDNTTETIYQPLGGCTFTITLGGEPTDSDAKDYTAKNYVKKKTITTEDDSGIATLSYSISSNDYKYCKNYISRMKLDEDAYTSYDEALKAAKSQLKNIIKTKLTEDGSLKVYYTIKEDKAPKGYEVDDTLYHGYINVKSTIDDENEDSIVLTKKITDKKYMAPIEVVKKDSKTGKEVSGAEFTIYQSIAGEEDPVVNVLTYDKATKTYRAYNSETKEFYTPVLYYNDNKGDYYIKETKTPPNYSSAFLDESGKETNKLSFKICGVNQLQYAGKVYDSTLKVPYQFKIGEQPWSASVNVIKYNDLTGEKLSGCTFSLLQKMKDGTYKKIKELKDNQDGSYSTGILYCDETNSNEFRIEETTASFGFYNYYTNDGYETSSEFKKLTNVFEFKIVGENKIVSTKAGESKNLGIKNIADNKEHVADEKNPFQYYAFNMPWRMKVHPTKLDSETNTTISGVLFNIIRYDATIRDYPIDNDEMSVKVDYTADGMKPIYSNEQIRFHKQLDGSFLSDWIYYNPRNEGSFYLVESKAASGYFGDWMNNLLGEKVKAAYYYTITDKTTESTKSLFDSKNNSINLDKDGNLLNTPIRGQVQIEKYDRETKTTTTQGDTNYKNQLNGAEYTLYAKEDIYCSDGSGKLILKKDESVAVAVIGKTPKTNEDGYVLNTDGSLHRLYPDKEIEYLNTPGKSGFYDIRLGITSVVDETSYYIKETKAAEGYLLDESIYTVTFKSDETKKIIKAETISSMEQVKKAAIPFVKLDYTKGQTELKGLAGAQFNIYLIKDLQGAKDWKEGDLEFFEHYDFSNDKTATVYQTDNWSEGDKLWLEKTGEKENQYRVKTMVSDKDGRFVTPQLPYGNYVLVETKAPDGRDCAKPMLVTIDKDRSEYEKPIEVRYVVDTVVQARIRVVKTDSLKNPLENQLNKNEKDSLEIIHPTDVLMQTVLKEGAKYQVRVVNASNKTLEDLKQMKWKVDENGYLSHYDSNNRKVMGTTNYPFTTTFERDKQDKIIDSYVLLPEDLPSGEYELVEVEAPMGYRLSQTPIPFNINEESVYPNGQVGANKNELQDENGNLVVTVLQENDEIRQKLEIFKTGERLILAQPDENNQYQFTYKELPVEGAVFEVIADEDIYYQQIDKSHLDEYGVDISKYLLYKKGSVVDTITTDKNGYAKVENLYLGKYKVKEVVAGNGYVRSKEEKEVEILDRDVQISYKNERQKVDIQIDKKDLDTGDCIEGATFGLYTLEDIEDFVKAGTLLMTAVTDKQGKIQFYCDGSLPLGKYQVKELKPSAGYVTDENHISKEIDATYGANGGQETETRVVNEAFKNEKTKHVFKKTDIVSGVEIEGATLSIYEADTNKLVETWVSTKEEHLVTGLEVGKNYILREELAPKNYLRNVNETTFYVEDTNKIISHTFTNERTRGKISITKTGEFLTGYEGKSFLDKMKESFYSVFRYEDLKIKQVSFNVYAAEDIYQPDGRNEIDYYKDTPLYKNALVATITTGIDGVATLGGEDDYLPLGSYYFVETDIGDDNLHYLNDKVVAVTLKWEDQDTKIVEAKNITFKNERRTIELSINKKTKATEWNQYVNEESEKLQEDKPLEGAFLGLYSQNEIKDRDLNVIVEKDTLLEVVKSDKDGKVSFKTDLPFGDYYVQEIKAPIGYQLSTEKIEFTILPTDSKENVIKKEALLYNVPTLVEIAKEDLVNESKLVEGAALVVTDSTGKVIDSWITKKKKHYIKNLVAGQKYTLTENLPATGYVTAESIDFVIKSFATNGDTKIQVQKQVMKDDHTKVQISKVDITSGKELPGAKLEIRNKKGEVVDSWVSSNTPRFIEYLPIGNYTLTETMAPDGYEVAETVKFSVKDTGEIQKVVMKDAKKTHENKKKEKEPSKTPKTGDTSLLKLWILLFIASISSWFILRRSH